MNEEECAALALLSRMRFACGDNGTRMQDELEEYLRELRRDAERYRWLRDEAFLAAATRIVQMLPGHMDAEIDAAMTGANAAVKPRSEAESA